LNSVRGQRLADTSAELSRITHAGEAHPSHTQLSPLNALGNAAVIQTLELSVGSTEADAAAAKHHRAPTDRDQVQRRHKNGRHGHRPTLKRVSGIQEFTVPT
jgi:hypothetical protein